jgi:PadR family transcriptional regulator PadR
MRERADPRGEDPRMMYVPKMPVTTQIVLQQFLDEPTRELYGREVSQVTGLLSGTVHPILAWLHDIGWLTQRWEDPEECKGLGRPRRRYYRMAPNIVNTSTIQALRAALDADREHVEKKRQALTERPPTSSHARSGRGPLSHIRAARGLTQEGLARMMGVTAPRVAQIENRRICSTEVGTLQRYFAGLGGTLRMTAEFDGDTVELDELTQEPQAPGRTTPP